MCKVYEKLIREYILDGIEAVLSDKQGGGGGSNPILPHFVHKKSQNWDEVK